MSTSGKKKGPPAHQNSFKFKHNPGSKKTKKIAAIQHFGLCRRCADIIQWKRDYRKYKPIKQAKKCHTCQQMNVNKAYHKVCDKCARARSCCPKCEKKHDKELIPKETQEDERNEEIKR